MAFDAGRAADNAIALMDAITPVQGTDAAAVAAYRKAQIQALFQGWYNEALLNMHATGNDSGSNTHNLNIA